MSAAMKRFVPWAIAIALLLAAWLVQLNAVDEYAYQQPFVTTVELGEQGTGRNIAVTVTEVKRATTISDDSGFTATGTWVVVDLSAEAVHSQERATMRYATLEVGGFEYSASERPTSFIDTALVPGVPKSGSLTFEVAPESLTGPLVFSFALDTITLLDSIVEVRVDESQLQTVTHAVLAPTGWATQ